MGVEIIFDTSGVFGVMIFVRFVAVTIAFVASLVITAPLKAQTSAVLNVSARVISECTVTVKSRRELVKLALELNDPGLIRRCSKGIVSRVDRQVVKFAKLRTRATASRAFAPTRISRDRIARRAGDDKADVVLVTVTY